MAADFGSSHTLHVQMFLFLQYMARIFAMSSLTELSITGGVANQTTLADVTAMKTCAKLAHLTLTAFSSVHITVIIEMLSRCCSHSIKSLSLAISAKLGNSFDDDKVR